ncbi:hypothetical protein Tco_1324881 [Tanacetum coccineum]
MMESFYIEAMQEEIHEFERLEVWELLPRPFNIIIINPKWIFKVKLDEYALEMLRGIFIGQSKYALEMLKIYGLEQCDVVDTPMVESHPDLVFHVCMCARYQAKLTEKHLTAVKRVFRYLKITINMGLWYSKDTRFDLTAFTDANHRGCQDSRKSTSRSAQFLGEKLVSWSSKKQKCTAISTTKAEYVSLSGCCA